MSSSENNSTITPSNEYSRLRVIDEGVVVLQFKNEPRSLETRYQVQREWGVDIFTCADTNTMRYSFYDTDGDSSCKILNEKNELLLEIFFESDPVHLSYYIKCNQNEKMVKNITVKKAQQGLYIISAMMAS